MRQPWLGWSRCCGAALGSVALALHPAAGDDTENAPVADERATPSAAGGADPASAVGARIEASAVRRTNGEWVLTRVAPAPDPVASAAPTVAFDPGNEDQRKLLHLLAEYERALERRDLGALTRIWVMNPAEREHLSGLLASGAPRVSIGVAEILVDGDQGVLRFDQELSFAPDPRPRASPLDRAYRRALAANDGVGHWSLDQLCTDDEQGAEPPTPRLE
jgi:hypothetical protein